MESNEYGLNDIVEMKKPHPCVNKSKVFQIIRLGADIKIKCLGCGNIIMLPRNDFNKKVKKLIKE
ncbi:MAG: DUF951 domain-containing protein [Bacillales bacterium]|nr:DUF951 domain-containing protein [Bacillales bacterium]